MFVNPKKPVITVREFYYLGKKENKTAARHKQSGQGTWGILGRLGATDAAAKNRLMSRRRFARLCDKAELDLLCSLGRGSEWKLRVAHVLQLIRIENRSQ